jgi:hypothetical protein
MAYLAPFNNVFEARNFLLIIFYTYVTEMAFGSSSLHRVLARILAWLAIGDFHYIM